MYTNTRNSFKLRERRIRAAARINARIVLLENKDESITLFSEEEIQSKLEINRQDLKNLNRNLEPNRWK